MLKEAVFWLLGWNFYHFGLWSFPEWPHVYSSLTKWVVLTQTSARKLVDRGNQLEMLLLTFPTFQYFIKEQKEIELMILQVWLYQSSFCQIGQWTPSSWNERIDVGSHAFSSHVLFDFHFQFLLDHFHHGYLYSDKTQSLGKRAFIRGSNLCLGFSGHQCGLDPYYQCITRFTTLCLHSIHYELFGSTDLCHLFVGYFLDTYHWTGCILGANGGFDRWTHQVNISL